MIYFWKSVALGLVICLVTLFLTVTVTFVGAPKDATEADVFQFLLFNAMVLWLCIAAGFMQSRNEATKAPPLATLIRTAFVWLPIWVGFGAVGEGYGITWFLYGMFASSVVLAYQFAVVPPKK